MPSDPLYEVYCLYTPCSATPSSRPDQRQKQVFGVASLRDAHVTAVHLNDLSYLKGTEGTKLADMHDWQISCRPVTQPMDILPTQSPGEMLERALEWLGLNSAPTKEVAHVH